MLQNSIPVFSERSSSERSLEEPDIMESHNKTNPDPSHPKKFFKTVETIADALTVVTMLSIQECAGLASIVVHFASEKYGGVGLVRILDVREGTQCGTFVIKDQFSIGLDIRLATPKASAKSAVEGWSRILSTLEPNLIRRVLSFIEPLTATPRPESLSSQHRNELRSITDATALAEDSGKRVLSASARLTDRFDIERGNSRSECAAADSRTHETVEVRTERMASRLSLENKDSSSFEGRSSSRPSESIKHDNRKHDIDMRIVAERTIKYASDALDLVQEAWGTVTGAGKVVIDGTVAGVEKVEGFLRNIKAVTTDNEQDSAYTYPKFGFLPKAIQPDIFGTSSNVNTADTKGNVITSDKATTNYYAKWLLGNGNVPITKDTRSVFEKWFNQTSSKTPTTGEFFDQKTPMKPFEFPYLTAGFTALQNELKNRETIKNSMPERFQNKAFPLFESDSTIDRYGVSLKLSEVGSYKGPSELVDLADDSGILAPKPASNTNERGNGAQSKSDNSEQSSKHEHRSKSSRSEDPGGRSRHS